MMSTSLSQERDCGRGNDAPRLRTHCADPNVVGFVRKLSGHAARCAAACYRRLPVVRCLRGGAPLLVADLDVGLRWWAVFYVFSFSFFILLYDPSTALPPRRRRTTAADNARTPRPRRRRLRDGFVRVQTPGGVLEIPFRRRRCRPGSRHPTAAARVPRPTRRRRAVKIRDFRIVVCVGGSKSPENCYYSQDSICISFLLVFPLFIGSSPRYKSVPIDGVV